MENSNLAINLKRKSTAGTPGPKPKVASFIKDVQNAGSLNLSQEVVLTLKATKKLPQDFKGPELDVAFHLHSQGLEAVDLMDKTYRSKTLSEIQKKQLYISGYIMSALEDFDQKQFTLIQEYNQFPQIESFQPNFVQSPSQNQFVLQSRDNVLSPVLQVGTDFLKDKLQNYAVGALKKGGQKIAESFLKKGVGKGVQVAVSAGLKAAGVAAAAPTAGLSLVISAAIELGQKVLGTVKNIFSRALRFFTGEKDFRKQLFLIGGGLTAIFIGLGQTGLALASGTVTLGAGASIVGGHAIASGAAGIGQTFIYGLTNVAIPSVLGPILIAIFVVPISVAVILFIINSGAYVVPPGGYETRSSSGGQIPPGGIVTYCDPIEAGANITQDLRSRITSGVVRLLPATNGAMAQEFCITPTMVILHSSGGYDNDLGNERVYETLVRRNVACQLATDTNDTYLMMNFYENQVQFPWCANSWNTFSINIELSGECQDSTSGQCARNYSACQVGTDSYPYIFGSPPPHPCPNETDLAVDAICEVMDQYNIPVSQIYRHDDVPDATHTDPVGVAYVNYLRQRVQNRCPHPEN